MKKLIPLLLILTLLFTACTSVPSEDAVDEPVDEVTVSDIESEGTGDTESPESSIFPQYNVIRVVDGDTIVIDFDSTDEKVRLIGVDTPESVHPDKTKNSAFGEEVSRYSKSQLAGKSVGIEFDVQERDQYGRLLAYVYIGNEMYNKKLLEMGYASVATFPPNVKYVDEFTEIQKNARENGVGMWANGFTAEEPSSGGSSDSTRKTSSGKYNGHIKNKKFHLPGCRYGDMISYENLIVFKDRDAAIDKGYAPCKVCNP